MKLLNFINLYLLEFSAVAYGRDTESCSYRKPVAYQKIQGIIDKEYMRQRDSLEFLRSF